MGIKGLWNILTPFCEKKPLYELEGKIIAIDLACWICEALTVVEYSVQPRFYIRNLFFRTYYLLLLGVHPVFVLDGKAPSLKYNTIAARNQIQFKGSKPIKNKNALKVAGKDRCRFNSVLKQCEELLNIMGIRCVHGWGEAEAMCAYLNADNFVDACITQDSDSFAYGAKVVFRNFGISNVSTTKCGSVDVYDITKVPNLGRNKMVALALLCGCDYDNGVVGVGQHTALKFLDSLEEGEILNRLKSWRTDSEKFEKMEDDINSPDMCTNCGHSGKLQKHTRSGCLTCNTDKGCTVTDYKEQRLLIKNELNIRSKALLDPNFPNQEIIDEFLVRKGTMPASLDLSWSQPDLIKFVKFVSKMIDWVEIYAVEKILPLLTRWQLQNNDFIANNTLRLKGVLYPNCIKKKCRPKGVQSFEIIWQDKDSSFNDLIPLDQINEWKKTNKQESFEYFWTTIEPEDLVTKAYPEMVQSFLESKIKKKPSKRKKVEAIDLEDLNDSLHRLFITKKPTKTKTLDEFFAGINISDKSKENISIEKSDDSEKSKNSSENRMPKKRKPRKKCLLESCFEKTRDNKAHTKVTVSETNATKKLLSYEQLLDSVDLNDSNFGNESTNLNVSDIVDTIINRGDLKLYQC